MNTASSQQSEPASNTEKHVKVLLPLKQRIRYSLYTASQEKLKRFELAKKNPKKLLNTVLLNLLQVLIIVVIGVGIYSFATGNSIAINLTASEQLSDDNGQNKNSSNSSESSSSSSTEQSNSPSAESNLSPDDNSQSGQMLSQQVEALILQDSNAESFIAIFQQNPDNWIGHIRVISDSVSGKVVIRTDYKYSNVTKADIRKYATYVFELVKDKIPSVMTITVITSDNYFLESVNRQ